MAAERAGEGAGKRSRAGHLINIHAHTYTRMHSLTHTHSFTATKRHANSEKTFYHAALAHMCADKYKSYAIISIHMKPYAIITIQ